jgi:dTDP-4-dehydrorhamnose reductase
MLAEFARSVNAHMTLVSTDLVFDGASAPSGGFNENHAPQPISVYARSKAAAERATLDAIDLNAVVRVSLLYGYSLSTSRGVIGWMEDCWSKSDPLKLFVDEFRTPIHVADAAYALLQISAQSRAGIWHCGGPARLSRLEFGQAVADALGYDATRIIPCYRDDVQSNPARPEDVSLDSKKIQTALDLAPHTVLSALRNSYDPRKSA